ncbi:MAG: hypothetical protein CSA33_08590 [Desulfobulbus propionicus]|nr:MAG: hypothetical protein CSA33_08590 [Desulfobulbus propionicus]
MERHIVHSWDRNQPNIFMTKNMRRLFFVLLLASCSCILTSLAGSEVVDKSVAVVNNEVITMSEVNELGAPLFQKAAAEAHADQLPAVMMQVRRSVIERLIEETLLKQEANRLNMRVSDSEIDQAVERIITKNQITREQFQADLRNMGMSEKQYREDLRGQILSSKLVGYEVRSKIAVPEEQIIAYYTQNYTESQGGGYYILQIGTKAVTSEGINSAAAKKQARKRIEKIHALAKRGQDFKTLAREHSELPSASDGGDLGTFQEQEMAPFMKQAVIDLDPGEISPIVETPGGYQFFTILSLKKGEVITKVPYDSVKDEIREILYEKELHSRFKQWFQGIKEKAYIKIL